MSATIFEVSPLDTSRRRRNLYPMSRCILVRSRRDPQSSPGAVPHHAFSLLIRARLSLECSTLLCPCPQPRPPPKPLDMLSASSKRTSRDCGTAAHRALITADHPRTPGRQTQYDSGRQQFSLAVALAGAISSPLFCSGTSLFHTIPLGRLLDRQPQDPLPQREG
ncbi:hypothetical protein K523DRAFT_123177 [Schizophyllum commune Tattone D]|nr:hypothetical protein K523DRAFT_123177 [Schizophyllum commune Tattone D]